MRPVVVTKNNTRLKLGRQDNKTFVVLATKLKTCVVYFSQPQASSPRHVQSHFPGVTRGGIEHWKWNESSLSRNLNRRLAPSTPFAFMIAFMILPKRVLCTPLGRGDRSSGVFLVISFSPTIMFFDRDMLYHSRRWSSLLYLIGVRLVKHCFIKFTWFSPVSPVHAPLTVCRNTYGCRMYSHVVWSTG